MEKPPLPHLFKRTTKICYFLLFLSFVFLFLFLHLLTPLHPLLVLRFASGYRRSHHGEKTCDYSSGKWVWDESYRNDSYTEDCSFLDRGFQCHRNGRKDSKYLYWRWQPHGCILSRFNASEMLERSRNGKIVFAGDSIGRNQWESLVCMLAKAVRNQSSIYEKYGSPITKHRGFLSIIFREHNLTVEYYRAPFLAAVSRPPATAPGHVRSAIHLDALYWQSKRWTDADVIVLNTGHWWNYKKTIGSGMYFQVGEDIDTTIEVKEAFLRTLETVELWVSKNLNLRKTSIFFRTHSPIHFSNGTWDGGGSCSAFAEPKDASVLGRPEPYWHNGAIASTVEGMKLSSSGGADGGGKVWLLDITYLTDLRWDAHPSMHREPGTPPGAPEDCSHWCLPGVPDSWNEILYAYLLSMGFDTSNKVNLVP